VGNQRQIVMGQYSGRNAVLAKMKELKIPENGVDLIKLVELLQHKSLVLQKNLTDAEFANLVRLVK
jgi:homocitrate synthase NifV